MNDLGRFFTAKINAWVEDEQTRAYLAEAWQDPQIALHVAGNHEAVRAAVVASRQLGYANVFGIRDRDFGPTNRPNWTTVDVFVTEVHELENYALDPEAIAACEFNVARVSATDVTSWIQETSLEMRWWMACRATIASLHADLVDGFPASRGWTITRDAAQAQAVITNSTWWTMSRGRAASLVTADIDSKIAAFHKIYSAANPHRDFSGKEILRNLWHRVWTKNERVMIDFVRAVARAQRANNRLPPEVVDLRNSLLSRI